jgi:hypothetical protein
MTDGYGNTRLAVTGADSASLSNAESTFCSKHLPFCRDFNVNCFFSMFCHKQATCVTVLVTWLKIQHFAGFFNSEKRVENRESTAYIGQVGRSVYGNIIKSTADTGNSRPVYYLLISEFPVFPIVLR